MSTKPTVNITEDEFDILAINAVRYCLGKSRFIVEEQIEVIKKYSTKLSKIAIDTIVRDIENSPHGYNTEKDRWDSFKNHLTKKRDCENKPFLDMIEKIKAIA